MGSLKPRHAGFALSKWAYGEGESIPQYEEVLRKLPASAAYQEHDYEEENPVSWAITFNHGSIGMTYTLPEFRRLGLATAIEIGLCRKLLEVGLRPCIDVDMHNEISVDLHHRAGFEVVETVAYAKYFPREK